MKHKIEWTRISSDINGNSRHVCHFLAVLGKADESVHLEQKYALALKRAATLGGCKFHNKQYGGGIVFQVSAGQLDHLSERIATLAGEQRFYPMSRRATIVCKFIPCTGAPNSDNRYSVTIRDFPRKYFDCSDAENKGIHSDAQAEYFARLRIDQLGLTWDIQAAGTLPTGEAVFTV